MRLLHAFLRRLIISVLIAAEMLTAAAAVAEDRSLEIAKGAARVPPGIYVMVRSSQLIGDQHFGESGLVEILKRRWVTAIALGLNWDVIFPEKNPDSYDALNMLLNEVRDASKKTGRVEPIPIFLKVYPVLPPWMQRDNPSTSSDDGKRSDITNDAFVKNKLGMTVLSRPTRRDATGREIPGRDYPISTDPAYQERLVQVMDKVSRWLERVDPNAEEIRLVHVIGPGMESNTMRPLAGSAFLTERSVPGALKWSKESLINAWINVSTQMANFPAFRKRCWVFNMTNLSPQRSNSNGFGLTVDDQLKVVNALRRAHPLGKDAILLKTEDLTVDFNNVSGRFNPLGRQALWRNQLLQGESYPYRYIASEKLHHGWELWASFFVSRDKRSSSLYPISQLIENSLYSDLQSPRPHVAQGTLWVEIWPDEVLHASEIRTDEDGVTFDQEMQMWHDELVELAHKVARS